MQYHEAVQIGRERARKAQYRLFEYTGFAFLLQTVKKVRDTFEPVGEDEYVMMVRVCEEYMLCLCDADGYVKAQSKPMEYAKAKSIYDKMLGDGFKEFKGSS